MGVRGELFSTKVSSEKRTYFFNVKENRVGDVFLNIVESKKGEEAEFERHQIMVYQEEIESFMKELQKAAAVIQKHQLVERAPARRTAPRRAPGAESASPETPKPARPRRPAVDRPEQVPTFALDGEWKGPEAMMAKGGKVARISRKDVEARTAKLAEEAAKAASHAAADAEQHAKRHNPAAVRSPRAHKPVKE